MRWYCMFCRAASRLKNSMLALLSDSVTLTDSSLNASSAGEGRKSFTTLNGPIGSLVYLIFALIDSPTIPPVTGAEDSDDITSIREPDSHDALADHSEAEIAFLYVAVGKIFGDNAPGIRKRVLSFEERHSVFGDVVDIFRIIPFNMGPAHLSIVRRHQNKYHTNVWR